MVQALALSLGTATAIRIIIFGRRCTCDALPGWNVGFLSPPHGYASTRRPAFKSRASAIRVWSLAGGLPQTFSFVKSHGLSWSPAGSLLSGYLALKLGTFLHLLMLDFILRSRLIIAVRGLWNERTWTIIYMKTIYLEMFAQMNVVTLQTSDKVLWYICVAVFIS